MYALWFDCEICVKGDHVTHGNLDLPIEESFFGDYFRTGDWGYKTAEGYIYLISRKKELINVGGKKVSPIEVEEQLFKVSGIADCACIDDIKNQLNGKLESYKLPVHYEWIDEIPKTQNGKIQRGLLK